MTTDAMWDAIAMTTPTVTRERPRSVEDAMEELETSPSTTAAAADGVSVALTMRDDAEKREAGSEEASSRAMRDARPSERARCARREAKRAVLSDAKCVPVVRFGSVQVGETGRVWLEIENDTASTQVRRGEPRTKRTRDEDEDERERLRTRRCDDAQLSANARDAW